VLLYDFFDLCPLRSCEIPRESVPTSFATHFERAKPSYLTIHFFEPQSGLNVCHLDPSAVILEYIFLKNNS
jgi:hypothetical protein